jgi:hypothetical protein
MIDKQPILNSFNQAVDQSLSVLNTELAELMQQRVNEIIKSELDSGLLGNRVERGIANFLSVMVDDSYKQALLSRIVQNTDQFVDDTFANVLADTRQLLDQRATEIVSDVISTVDFVSTVRSAIYAVLSNPEFVAYWPKNSIPADVVDFNNLTFSASTLTGGTARNFASTGIADRATTTTRVTVYDDHTEIRGNLQVEGHLKLGGLVNTDSEFYRDLSQNLQDSTIEQVADLVKTEISTQLVDTITDKINSGIDAATIQFRNESLVVDAKLNRFVTESNLQKVGRLRELDVGGEVSLFDTVRIVKRRVGINTIEPETALDLWDQEVQIVAGKIEANTGYIGLGRSGLLKLGVNRNNAITILPNGGVEIPDLRLGQFEKIAITVSGGIPATPGTPGDIMFNSDPKSNGVFAWVCLEGTRWAPVRLDM